MRSEETVNPKSGTQERVSKLCCTSERTAKCVQESNGIKQKLGSITHSVFDLGEVN